jgi:Na+/H+ antiporter NhaC
MNEYIILPAALIAVLVFTTIHYNANLRAEFENSCTPTEMFVYHRKVYNCD